MTLAIDVDNAALRRALQDMPDEIERALSIVVKGTAAEVEGGVKERIRQVPKTGRIYQKYNPRRTHQASALGEAPATDTGELINSIYTEDLSPLTAMVTSRLALATWLEYGTTRIAARPAWVPTVEEQRPLFAKRVEAAVKGAMR